MMWPMPGAMALSEHLLGLSLVATPLQLARRQPDHRLQRLPASSPSRCRGSSPILLGRRLTGSTLRRHLRRASRSGSHRIARASSRTSRCSRRSGCRSRSSACTRTSTPARRRWLVVFGAAWLLQALSNGYFLLFFPVLIAAWLAWFVDWRRAPRRGLAIVAAWVVASLPLAADPARSTTRSTSAGADAQGGGDPRLQRQPASFFHAAPLMRFWREGPAHELRAVSLHGPDGGAARARRPRRCFLCPRDAARPCSRDRAPIVFYALATLLMWVLALGPGGQGTSRRRRSSVHLAALAAGLQRPARYGALRDARHALCLAMTASLAVALPVKLARSARRLAGRWLGACRGRRARPSMAMTAPVPVADAAGPRDAARRRSRRRSIELPIDNIDVSVQAMYRSMFHRQPLVNGYSGHFPPHYNILSLSLAAWRHFGTLLPRAARRPLVIVVNDQFDHEPQLTRT